MSLRVVAWNMQHQKEAANWDRLLDWSPITRARLYLLCEAVPPPKHIMDELCVAMHGSTKETRCPCEGDKCDNRTFSTAIASPDRVEPLSFRPRVRYGTWIACRVQMGALPVTAIALYGLKDEAYTSYWESTKESISEIFPILEDKEYGKHVLLAGDFNILAGAPRYGGHQVLEAIEGYGLVDCLKAKVPESRYNDARRRKDMDDCQCGMGPECLHTRTFLMPSDAETPHQDDYLFASGELADLLVTCEALPLDRSSHSDHAPIVAEFDI